MPACTKASTSGNNWNHVLTNDIRTNGQVDVVFPDGVEVKWIEVDSNSPNNVWVGDYVRLLQSTDGGTTWENMMNDELGNNSGLHRNRGYSGWVSRNYEFNPFDTNQVVAQGMDTAKLLISQDGGSTWRREIDGHVIDGQTQHWNAGNDIAFASATTSFAVFGQGNDCDPCEAKSYAARSTNGGFDWQILPLPAGVPTDLEFRSIHVNPAEPNRVWFHTTDQLYRSNNALATASQVAWQPVNDFSGADILAIENDPHSALGFYVMTSRGLYYTDDGTSFEQVGGVGLSGPQHNARRRVGLEADPNQPGVLYVANPDPGNANWDGLWRYENAGNQHTWQRMLAPQFTPEIREWTWTVAVDPNDSSRIVVGTNKDPYADDLGATGVWISEDGGANFAQHNNGLGMLRILTTTFSPDGSKLIVGTGGRGWYTADVDLIGGGDPGALLGSETNRWTFDSDALDSIGTVDGVFENGTSIDTTDPLTGTGAARFDGINDYVNIDNSQLEDSFANYSVSAWFKADDTIGSQVIYEEGGGTNGLALRINGDSLQAAVRNGGASTQRTSVVSGVVPGQWHHAVVTFDEGELTLYMDGSANSDTKIATFTEVRNHGDSANLGRQTGSAFGGNQGFYFEGLIDDVRVFDGTALGTAEVDALFGESGVGNTNAYSNRWTFDSDANDATGIANGSFAGGASASGTNSVVGTGAVSLDGTNDYVNLDNPALEDSFSQYSVTVWFQADNTNGTQVIYEEGGSTNGLALRLSGNTLQAAVRNGGDSSQTTASIANVTAGVWHLAVVTFDNGQLRLSLDGSSNSNSQTAAFSTVNNHGDSANIGRQTGSAFGGGTGSYFDGFIDDVRVYDGIALSDSDIDLLFSQM